MKTEKLIHLQQLVKQQQGKQNILRHLKKIFKIKEFAAVIELLKEIVGSIVFGSLCQHTRRGGYSKDDLNVRG